MSNKTIIIMATGLMIMFLASFFASDGNTLALFYALGFCIAGIGFFWKIKEDKNA